MKNRVKTVKRRFALRVKVRDGQVDRQRGVLDWDAARIGGLGERQYSRRGIYQGWNERKEVVVLPLVPIVHPR
ncbi:hypothetical protein SDC9_186329 [bioreactor metagenome]|uniref:Uncharacterized protein n=1 Tax=bioreactor metagenome TaxID=1076179 RepID=A0A645HRP2_9ZZZZ